MACMTLEFVVVFVAIGEEGTGGGFLVAGLEPVFWVNKPSRNRDLDHKFGSRFLKNVLGIKKKIQSILKIIEIFV